MFFCSMCSFTSANFASCNSHIIRLHRNDANFIVNCCINDCQYVSRSWNAYKMHVSRTHREADIDDAHVHDVDLNGHDADLQADPADVNHDGQADQEEHRDNALDQKYFDAKFLLALKVDHNLSDRGVQSVIGNMTDLVSNHLMAYKTKIANALTANGHHAEFLNDIATGENSLELFSKHKHLKFLEKECGLVRSVPVLMGEKLCEIRGNVRVVKKFAYIVPFVSNLTKLLSMPEVWHWVVRSHRSRDGIMRDICDGSYMREVRAELGVNDIYLELILYMDDIEVVNPIGSHVKKHKVTMIYFTISNIPPEFRSKFESIQLLAVVKSLDIKSFGLKNVLKDFIDSMNLLKGIGIVVTVDNNNVTVKGSLVIAPADTPAAQFLGGFKEGVGFATKICRTCDASKTDIKGKFIDGNFRRRTHAEHIERLEVMEEMSANARMYWSRNWGINSRSPLLDIGGVDLADCLVHDPMHVLSEGLLGKEVCLMLYDFVKVRKYFSLTFLNHSLAGFSFSYLEEKDKPQIITIEEVSNGKLKQTAAAMMSLCCSLPLVIGPKVPEDDGKWKNFLRMIQISLLATSPYTSEDTAAHLEQLVYTHHQEFKIEYPKSNLTPKFHFLVHIPRQLRRFGPGRNQWVMRFEGKHLFFKNIKWKCFKNIALSLSMRHQLWMCWRQLGVTGKPSENFLYSGDVVTKMQPSCVDQVDAEVHEYLVALNMHLSPLYSTTEFEIKGHRYKIGCVIVLDYIDSLPTFGVVDQLFVTNQEKVFVVDQLDIESFDSHTLYYRITRSNTKICLKYTDLKFVWPLSMHTFNGYTVVLDKYCFFCEAI